MADKKVLNEEELNKVNGGDEWGDKMGRYLPKGHGIHIGKYAAEGHLNKKVYIVNDSHADAYYWGILNYSHEEESVFFGTTKRVHHITVEGCSNSNWCNRDYIGRQELFYGDSYTLFLYE